MFGCAFRLTGLPSAALRPSRLRRTYWKFPHHCVLTFLFNLPSTATTVTCCPSMPVMGIYAIQDTVTFGCLSILSDSASPPTYRFRVRGQRRRVGWSSHRNSIAAHDNHFCRNAIHRAHWIICAHPVAPFYKVSSSSSPPAGGSGSHVSTC